MAYIEPTKIKKWKTINSKDISPSKWFPVRMDEVEIKTGKVIDFYILDMADASMVFPLDKEGNLILVRQYKHGTGDIIIEGPAGMIEKGQTPTECAIRELEEETGIKYNQNQLIELGVHMQSPTKSSHKLYGYLALNCEFNSVQELEETEDIEILKIKPSVAINMIKSGEIWASDTVAFILKIKLLYPELF